jgi:hypothetical protein
MYLFSEANYIAVFHLSFPDDRKKIYSICGDDIVLKNPPQYCWRWIDIGHHTVTTYGAVPIL